MNKVMILGRITKALEVKKTPSNTSSLRFYVAVRRDFKNKQTGEYDADFVPVVAFGERADAINKYFGKGDRIIIYGHILTGSYDGQNGKVYTTDVVCDGFEFVDAKKSVAPVEDYEEVNLDDELPF